MDDLSKILASTDISQRHSPEAADHAILNPSERLENHNGVESQPPLGMGLSFQSIQRLIAKYQKYPSIQYPFFTKEYATKAFAAHERDPYGGSSRAYTIIGAPRRFSQCVTEQLKSSMFSQSTIHIHIALTTATVKIRDMFINKTHTV